jgi:DNA-binding MarR family transcriptional regulator
MSRSRKELMERLAWSFRQALASAILFNQKVAEDAGINLRDLQVMHLLQLNGPSTPRDLARRASITTGGMTVVLDRLEKDGYVKRQANPDDRRSSIVHLIPERLSRVEGAYRAKAAMLAGAMERYSDRDLKMLIGFFEKVHGGGEEEYRLRPPRAGGRWR